MPELPEVETVVRSLRPILIHRRIDRIHRYWPRVIQTPSLSGMRTLFEGQAIAAIERRAKFVVLVMKDGSRMLIHLRMTGKLYPADFVLPPTRNYAKKKHISALIEFDAGPPLVFEDQRKFGRLYGLRDDDAFQTFFDRYGPEPLGDDFLKREFVDRLRGKRRQMKPLLLDQSFISGLGNIYVDEALWKSRIHPLALSDSLDRRRAGELHSAIQSVLKKSIEANGTTFMNFKFLGGESGGYTDQLLVFGRTGQPCLRCKTKIEKIRVGQRGTHVCQRCQSLS